MDSTTLQCGTFKELFFDCPLMVINLDHFLLILILELVVRHRIHAESMEFKIHVKGMEDYATSVLCTVSSVNHQHQYDGKFS